MDAVFSTSRIYKFTGQIQKIIIKYIEQGHSFLPGDSFLAAVEKVVKKRENIYGF